VSRPIRNPQLWLGIGATIAALITLGFLAFLTRTDRGRAEILAYTLGAVGGRLNGTLSIDHLEGSLLSGARLYGLSITDTEGEPLLRADSGYLEYEAPTLLGGDVVINHLVLYGADLFLHRFPGDTLWNYQAVLADTTPGEPDRVPRATLIERLRLVDARITVRTPWEPSDDLAPAEREREIHAALSDTGRLVVQEVPGGLLRTMRFDLTEVRGSGLVIAPNERGGTLAQVDSAAGEIRVWRDPPLELNDLRGRLHLANKIFSFVLDQGVAGKSGLSGGGRIDSTSGDQRYDLVFAGAAVALSDLQWLYPSIPDDGTLGGRVVLETRPEGFRFGISDALLETPDTRIAGDFGIVVGDTLRFTDVNLRAAPLRVETVQRMLPGSTPIEGLRIGSVVIESPERS
jgi:hypothetical protein